MIDVIWYVFVAVIVVALIGYVGWVFWDARDTRPILREEPTAFNTDSAQMSLFADEGVGKARVVGTRAPDESMLSNRSLSDSFVLFEEPSASTQSAPIQSAVYAKPTATLSQSDGAYERPAAVKTIALILMAPEGQPYTGQEVLEVAEELNLTIGPEGFLEHITTTYYGDEAVYSIAHMLHPGSFMQAGIKNMALPGLVFFMQVPGPDPEMESIDFLLTGAAHFGRTLGGTLLDDLKRPMDRASVTRLRQEVSGLEAQCWEDNQSGMMV